MSFVNLKARLSSLLPALFPVGMANKYFRYCVYVCMRLCVYQGYVPAYKYIIKIELRLGVYIRILQQLEKKELKLIQNVQSVERTHLFFCAVFYMGNKHF